MIDLNDTLCIMQRRVVKTILMAVIESGGHHPKTGLAIAMPVFAAFGVHHGCLKRLLEPMERSGWVAVTRAGRCHRYAVSFLPYTAVDHAGLGDEETAANEAMKATIVRQAKAITDSLLVGDLTLNRFR
jgi:hypothetical protein